jgi:hypothetical protein
MYSTNALCQQLVLTVACSGEHLCWIMKPYIQQAILNLYQSTKHEFPVLLLHLGKARCISGSLL